MDDDPATARAPYMIVASVADGTRALDLAAELRALATQLERQAFGPESPDRGHESADAVALAAYARSVGAARRALDHDLGGPGGADPMLEVLLDMFAAGGEGESSRAGARGESGGPTRTRSRWTEALRGSDLIEEREGGTRLVLATRGTKAVRSFLQAISAAAP